MLSDATVQRVLDLRRLLGEAGSRRLIAGLCGISRGSVSAILSGRRRPGQRRATPRDCESLSDDCRCGPIGRCGTCGAKVHLPCHACRVRALVAEQAGQGAAAARDLPAVGVELAGDERRRYQEVRAVRQLTLAFRDPAA